MTNFLESLIHLNQPEWISAVNWRYLSFLPMATVGFILTFLITPIVGYTAKTLKIQNETKKDIKTKVNKHENIERRINPNSVPLLGGLAVLIPFIVLIVVTFGFTDTTTPIIMALSLLTFVGILDDIYNLPATVQFTAQITAAMIVAASLIDVDIVNIPFIGPLSLDYAHYISNDFLFPIRFLFPGDLLMVLWIVTLINAVKWVGGIDALMEGNLAIAFPLIYVIAIRTNSEFVILSSIFLFGSISAFTIFNLPPAKIFTGNTGKTTYGFLIAIMSVINDTKVAITLMILLLPLIDFIIVILKRASILKPKSMKELIALPLRIMRMPDTNHLHHKLLSIGLTIKQVLLVEFGISLFIGIIAISTTAAYRLMIVFILALGLIIAILGLHLLSRKNFKIKKPTEEEDENDSPESRYSY